VTHFEVTQYEVGGPLWIEVNPIQVTEKDRRVDVLLTLSEDEAHTLCQQIFDATFERANEAAMAKFSKEPR